MNAYIPKHDVLPALSQRLSKAAFGQLAPQIERQLDPSSQLVEAMTSLYELKKMNDGWLDETKLDRWDFLDRETISTVSFCF